MPYFLKIIETLLVSFHFCVQKYDFEVDFLSSRSQKPQKATSVNVCQEQHELHCYLRPSLTSTELFRLCVLQLTETCPAFLDFQGR